MKTKLLLFITIALVFAMCTVPIARGEEVLYNTIHTYAYRTTRSITSGPGDKMGCMTSGIMYTFWFDAYYKGHIDEDERITELKLKLWDGSSWVDVTGVSWSYNTTGDPTWYPFTGLGDNIDVPYQGHNGVSDGSEPHTTIRVTFLTSGSLGDEFYFQIWGKAYKFTNGLPDQPASFSTCYFWYEICSVPYETPEFPVETSVITSLGFATVYGIRRRRLSKL